MSEEVQISIEDEEQDEENEIQLSHEENEIQPSHEENEIQPSHEDTDHGFNESDEDLLKDLEKQEAETTSTNNEASQNNRRKVRTKIQKVPEILKDRDQTLIKQYFTPSEISIGPVHAVNNKLIKKKLKRRLAARFLAESEQTAETLLGKVKADIAELKECYDQTVIEPFNDDHLARILFIDGCFVLQFVHDFVRNKFKISPVQSGSIQNDLFLLENQVPFRLLKLLINSSNEKCVLVNSIYEFIATNTISPPDCYDNWRSLRRSKLNKPEPILFDKDKEPVHLLDLLRSELLFNSCVENDDKTTDYCHLQTFHKDSFRNVQDLKARGIKFRPSKSPSFRAVSFSPWWWVLGRLSLPPMLVDNSTASKLWNLVAYEMCPDNYACNFWVSSYLSLLDSLIDNEKDVRDLTAEHVLRNRLRSDQEAALFFHKIGSNLVSNDAYLGVKKNIQLHCNRRRVMIQRRLLAVTMAAFIGLYWLLVPSLLYI